MSIVEACESKTNLNDTLVLHSPEKLVVLVRKPIQVGEFTVQWG